MFSYLAIRLATSCMPILLVVSLSANLLLALRIREQSSLVRAVGTSGAQLKLDDSAFMAIAAKDAPAIGKITAPVTLVVFSDFQCPYCRQFAAALAELQNDRASKLRVVLREFPIKRHPFAQSEATLAACVANQSFEAFYSLYEYFYKDTARVNVDLTPTGRELVMSRQDVDAARLEECESKSLGAELVKHDVQLADSVGVNETPTVFVNGRRLTGNIYDTAYLRNAISSPELQGPHF